MGTRCGNLDPGVILHLMETKNPVGRDYMTKMLYKGTGLLGVSGLSQDMRTLLASDKAGSRRGSQPVLLPHRPRARLTGCRSRRPGCAGVHQRYRRARRRSAPPRLPAVGMAGHPRQSGSQRPPRTVHLGRQQQRRLLVIPTNEEWMMAHHAQTLLAL